MHQYNDSPTSPQYSARAPIGNTYTAQPPAWVEWTPYYPGAVVWSAGTFWRCEHAYSGGPFPQAAPQSNLHLWTPVSSTGQPFAYLPPPPGPALYNQQQAGPSILSPQPLPMPMRPPSLSENGHSDSNSSGETVRPGEKGDHPSGASSSRDDKKGFPPGPTRNMDFFTQRAGESLRYITLKEEERKATEHDELKDELKGKRVWRVGGLGMWSYSLDPKAERDKMDVWRKWSEKHSGNDGKQKWAEAAKARTEFYNRDTRGVKPLFMWKLVQRGERLPLDALPIGREDNGALLYAARAYWEGGLHLGKSGAHLVNSASLSYGGSEHNLDTYEVFCGPPDPSLIKWMTFDHGQRAGVEGWQPVEGGREKDGSSLLLAKGQYENGEHPGKCLVNDDHACVGWGGGELWVRPFQVLAYCSSTRR